MSVKLFRDDGQGYAAWLAANAQWYVLSIQRMLTPADGRVPFAWCPTITGARPHGRTWTGLHVKPCCGLLARVGRPGARRVGHHPMRYLSTAGSGIDLVVKYQAQSADTLSHATVPPLREAA